MATKRTLKSCIRACSSMGYMYTSLSFGLGSSHINAWPPRLPSTSLVGRGTLNGLRSSTPNTCQIFENLSGASLFLLIQPQQDAEFLLFVWRGAVDPASRPVPSEICCWLEIWSSNASLECLPRIPAAKATVAARGSSEDKWTGALLRIRFGFSKRSDFQTSRRLRMLQAKYA